LHIENGRYSRDEGSSGRLEHQVMLLQYIFNYFQTSDKFSKVTFAVAAVKDNDDQATLLFRMFQFKQHPHV